MSTLRLLELILGLKRHLVGNLELGVARVGGELDARHLLNNVHDIGSIWKILHNILTSLSDPVPNVPTDGELSDMKELLILIVIIIITIIIVIVIFLIPIVI